MTRSPSAALKSVTTSSPPPDRRMKTSAPAPPVSVSLPDPPSRRSLPLPPSTVSVPAVPAKLSALLLPLIRMTCPLLLRIVKVREGVFIRLNGHGSAPINQLDQ